MPSVPPGLGQARWGRHDGPGGRQHCGGQRQGRRQAEDQGPRPGRGGAGSAGHSRNRQSPLLDHLQLGGGSGDRRRPLARGRMVRPDHGRWLCARSGRETRRGSHGLEICPRLRLGGVSDNVRLGHGAGAGLVSGRADGSGPGGGAAVLRLCDGFHPDADRAPRSVRHLRPLHPDRTGAGRHPLGSAGILEPAGRRARAGLGPAGQGHHHHDEGGQDPELPGLSDPSDRRTGNRTRSR